MSASSNQTAAGASIAQTTGPTLTYAGNSESMGGDALAWEQISPRTDDRRRQQIRANATTLQEREWEMLDDGVMPVALETLTAIDDLENAGLTLDISMAHTVSKWELTGEMTPAEYTMDARATAEEDTRQFAVAGVPIPFTHKDYRISRRELEASRNMGTSIDTMNARSASRVVAEGLENLLINGWNARLESNGQLMELYGYRTHPDRNPYSGASWSTDPSNATEDVNQMIAQAENVNYDAGSTGYWLYLSKNLNQSLRNDYAVNADAGVRQTRNRLEEINELSKVETLEYLPPGEAVLLKPVPEVIDLARDPAGVQNVQWESGSGMEIRNKVMALYAPRLKSDLNGQMGLVHASGLS